MKLFHSFYLKNFHEVALRAEAKAALLKSAHAMKKRGKMTDAEIAADLDLTEAEVADIKID